MAMRKTELVTWLTDQGLIVEGVESYKELYEAYRYVKRARFIQESERRMAGFQAAAESLRILRQMLDPASRLLYSGSRSENS